MPKNKGKFQNKLIFVLNDLSNNEVHNYIVLLINKFSKEFLIKLRGSILICKV